jgi:hypothetical protein
MKLQERLTKTKGFQGHYTVQGNAAQTALNAVHLGFTPANTPFNSR